MWAREAKENGMLELGSTHRGAGACVRGELSADSRHKPFTDTH